MRGGSLETLLRCAGSSELEQPGETSTFDTDGVEVTLGRVEIFSLCVSSIHETASLLGHGQSLCWFSTTRNDFFFPPKLI